MIFLHPSNILLQKVRGEKGLPQQQMFTDKRDPFLLSHPFLKQIIAISIIHMV